MTTSIIPVVNIESISAVIAVIGAFFGIFGYSIASFLKGKSAGSTAANEATEFVINSLKEQIAILKVKVDQQEEATKTNAQRIDALVKENHLLREVLQGRDAETQKFQQQGFDVMNKVIPEMLKMTMNTNQNVEQLYKAIEKHLSHMEDITLPTDQQ